MPDLAVMSTSYPPPSESSSHQLSGVGNSSLESSTQGSTSMSSYHHSQSQQEQRHHQHQHHHLNQTHTLPPISSYHRQYEHQNPHQSQNQLQRPFALHQHQHSNVGPPPPLPPSSSYPPQPQQQQQLSSAPTNHQLHHTLPPTHHTLILPPFQQTQHQLPHLSQPPPPPPSSRHLSSPTYTPSRTNEALHTSAKDEHKLVHISKVDDSTGRRYSLNVAQQPVRARMCGFGDKDRRPITPPPCVRLVLTDPRTGKELDINAIDYGMFVLNVDLWDETALKEVNLVRSSQDASSSSYGHTISSASSREPSYAPTQTTPIPYVQDYPTAGGYSQTPSYPPNGSYGPPTQYFPNHQSASGLGSQSGVSPFAPSAIIPGAYGPEQTALARMAMVGGQPHGMFTRNLIGSLASGAFRLVDTDDCPGIWFVLQDLSVRTEGAFRLKFSFVDVSQREYNSLRGEDEPSVNTSRAPILATAFTEVFTVYSAKKFPGVCESTSLSKTFAAQGIKIPIRKDAKGGEGNEDDD